MRLGNMFKRGMSCQEVLEVMQAYLDGEVDVEVARQVSAHLVKCTRCETETHVYRQIKVSLSSRSIVVDPEVMAALSDFGHNLMHEDR